MHFQDNFLMQHGSDNSTEKTDLGAEGPSGQCDNDDMAVHNGIIAHKVAVTTSTQQEEEVRVSLPTSIDSETQRPMVPIIPYKKQCERQKREMRARSLTP